MTRAAITEFLSRADWSGTPARSGDVGRQLEALGVGRGSVVIIADRVVHKNGLTSALLWGLVEAGDTPHVFAEIAGEPEIEQWKPPPAWPPRPMPSRFVGIGGGSALDTAKLVAYYAASGASLRDLKGAVPFADAFGPLVTVPTTVGTGAEATRVAMFSFGGAKRAVLSPQFVPALAVLDEDLTRDLPAPVVASTALDALSHAISR